MTLRLTVLWMVLGVLAAFGLYMVKYKVQAIKSEVAAAETQLREEKKNLHVLTAEWTYLNRPDRLHALAAKYLNVKPIHAQQLADFSALQGMSAPQAQPAVSEKTKPAHSTGALHAAKAMTLASGAAHAR